MRVDVRKVACWVLGAAASMAILAHGSGYAEFNGSVMVVFVGLAVGLGVLFARLSAHAEWLSAPKSVWFLALLSAVIAGGLYYIAPVRSDAFHRTGWLVVAGSAQRDASSQGTEVWATVRKPDGQAVPPNGLGEGWIVNEAKQAVLAQGATTTVSWRVPYDAGWQLHLLKHPWSGHATVEWNGERRSFDLRGTGTDEVVPLTGRGVQGTRGRALNLVVALCDVLVGTALVLMLIMAVRSRLRRK
ncbi:MAG TPA: hypothetical protein VGD21_11070 [Lysobacter sp.]